MDEAKIQQFIKDQVALQVDQYLKSADGNQVQNHVHSGIDAPRIPFPKNVVGTVLTAAIPSGYGKDGDIILTNISGTRKIWGRLSGVWYGVAIT